MKRITLLLIFLPAFHLLQSQVRQELHGSGFAFGNNVNVREGPDANAAVLTRLKIGEEVTLLAHMEQSYVSNGLKNPWVQIKTAGGITGYVWGGLIARISSQVELLQQGKGLLMAGLLGKNEKGLRWAMRLVVNGNVNEFPFEGSEKDCGLLDSEDGLAIDFGGLSVETRPGFTPAMQDIRLFFYDCSGCCGGMTDLYAFTWNGGELNQWFHYRGQWGYGYEGPSYEIYFSGEENVPANQVLVKWGEIKMEEAEVDYSTYFVTDRTETFEWNGKNLVLKE